MERTEIDSELSDMGERAKSAAMEISRAAVGQKNAALLELAELLHSEAMVIETANRQDLAKASHTGLSGAKLDRLRLSPQVLDDLVSGLRQIAAMPDPVGEIAEMRQLHNGLMVGRMRIPLGVVGIIYESRPNVTVEAAALTLKAGNTVLLRGGSEATHSNRALVGLFRRALASAGLPQDAVQLVHRQEREAISAMCRLEGLLDVIIPRGGEALIRKVSAEARMPVLKHDKGVVHLYVDESADLEMAVHITVNAKTQRPGVCNALETLLVHQKVSEAFLPRVGAALTEEGVRIFACEKSRPLLVNAEPASDADWEAEYLDLVLAVRVVTNMDQALSHIARYGSNHTEAIVTKDYQRAQRFLREVDASLVLVNASTRFNDGFQLGLGAEIGVSTSKLHAYGPMGVRELTTTKFIAMGDGQIRG